MPPNVWDVRTLDRLLLSCKKWSERVSCDPQGATPRPARAGSPHEPKGNSYLREHRWQPYTHDPSRRHHARQQAANQINELSGLNGFRRLLQQHPRTHRRRRHRTHHRRTGAGSPCRRFGGCVMKVLRCPDTGHIWYETVDRMHGLFGINNANHDKRLGRTRVGRLGLAGSPRA